MSEYYADFPYEDEGNTYDENVYDPNSSGIVDGSVYEGTEATSKEESKEQPKENTQQQQQSSDTKSSQQPPKPIPKPPKARPKIVTVQNTRAVRRAAMPQQGFTIDWKSFMIGFGAGFLAVWAYHKFFNKA